MSSLFKEHFGSFPEIVFEGNSSRINSILNGFVVFYCCFESLRSDYGSSIFLSNSLSKIVIDSSSFINCSSYYDGGSIYFYCPSESGCIVSRVRGFNCFCGNNNAWDRGGQFSLIWTSLTGKNYFFDCSVSYCSPSGSSTRRSSVLLRLGNQKVHSFNSSNNHLYRHSSICLFGSNTLLMEYGSIVGNTAIDCMCFLFVQTITESNVIKFNFVNNTSPYSGLSLSEDCQTVYYLDCMIYGKQNVHSLFSVTRSPNFVVNNCFISSGFVFGSMNGNNNTINEINTYSISHYYFENCYSIEKTKIMTRSFLFLILLNHLVINT